MIMMMIIMMIMMMIMMMLTRRGLEMAAGLALPLLSVDRQVWSSVPLCVATNYAHGYMITAIFAFTKCCTSQMI